MVKEILEEREKTHGCFADNAQCSVQLKATVRGAKLWDLMQPDKQEALDCILAKVSRIVTGNSNHIDSWEDIAGYATLVAERLKNEPPF